MEPTGLDILYVAIDSRSRDVHRYPDVSEYVVPLNYTLRDVESIEIMALQLGRGETNIHSGNRTLFVSVAGATPVEVSLDALQYTTSALLTALTTALQAVDASFLLTTDSANRLTITCGSPFVIHIQGSLDRILGFPSTTLLTSGTSLSLTAPYPMDMAGEPYLLLYINDWDRYIGSSKALDAAFFMIPFEERPWRSRFHICNSELEKKGIYLLNNTHRNLSSLRIRFARPDGTNYDFGGMDHQIVLRITARNKVSN